MVFEREDWIMQIIEMLITPISTISGLLMGSFSTYITQSKITEKELKKENKKERQMLVLDCLEIYNEILKLDGENYLGNLDDPKFEQEVYEEKIRPVFYSKFHLLHKDVAEKVRRIDKITAKVEENLDGLDGEQQRDTLLLYDNLILNIEEHIESLRNLHV